MEKIATRDAYGQALVKLGAGNPRIVVLDADLSKSTKTADFQKQYPERFFNMGIAEQNMMGAAAGLAAAGKIPFASTFAIFATGRAFEQIRNSIAYTRLNVKIAATHAGLTVGEDGASHQAIVDISLMRSLPNMTVLVPADAVETEKAVFAAAALVGPVYIRLGRPAVPVLFDRDYPFAVGRAAVLRPGSDATVLACGYMLFAALQAAAELEQEGISVRIVNMSTIKPLDRKSSCRQPTRRAPLSPPRSTASSAGWAAPWPKSSPKTRPPRWNGSACATSSASRGNPRNCWRNTASMLKTLSRLSTGQCRGKC